MWANAGGSITKTGNKPIHGPPSLQTFKSFGSHILSGTEDALERQPPLEKEPFLFSPCRDAHEASLLGNSLSSTWNRRHQEAKARGLLRNHLADLLKEPGPVDDGSWSRSGGNSLVRCLLSFLVAADQWLVVCDSSLSW